MLRTCHVAVALLGVAAAGISAATAPMSPRNSRTGAQQQQQQQQRQGMNLNVDLGLLAENKAHGVLGGQNGHVLHRATATGVYPGWDRGMWSRVSVSTGNWTPGDPINNTTKIPLGVGLNYLHQMLQMAIEVEHSVIPPYLTAMYSVISDGTDHEAWVAGTVRDVVIEEMLHMTIACNVLNAHLSSSSHYTEKAFQYGYIRSTLGYYVGGAPYIDRPDFVPNYPMALPVLNISIGIEPFSITQAYKFRLIERPVANDTADGQHASAGHAAVSSHGTFGGSTITAVYDYIVALMTQLCIQHGEQNVFTGDDAHQVALHSATVGEAVTAVTNLTSAVQALYDVVEQGAGMNTTDAHAGPLSPDSTAYSHFVRFEEIYQGRMFHNNDTAASGPTGPTQYINWTAIYDFQPNPTPADHPSGSIEAAELTWFANNYTDLLVELHETFNGAPSKYFDTLAKMYQLNDYAVALMQVPDPRFPRAANVYLGPNWNWQANRSKYGRAWSGYSPMPPRPTWGG